MPKQYPSKPLFALSPPPLKIIAIPHRSAGLIELDPRNIGDRSSVPMFNDSLGNGTSATVFRLMSDS
jgi:hypothetical protein